MQVNLHMMPLKIVKWIVIEYIKSTSSYSGSYSVLTYASLSSEDLCKIGEIIKTSLINEVQRCNTSPEINLILDRTAMAFPGMLTLGWHVCEWWKHQLVAHDFEKLREIYNVPDNLIENLIEYMSISDDSNTRT